MNPKQFLTTDVIIEQHKKEKEESIKFKERRFAQWNENYFLYRDRIITNRLTQRQTVNIPIVRETLQTWISKIDEAPILKFETRGKDNASKDGEIILNEIWDYYYNRLSLDLVDNMEKKIVGLQGRGFKRWSWSKNEIHCDLIDPYDIDIDPRSNPLDINGTADHVIHKHIFVPLRKILANKKYSADGKSQLKMYLDSKQGLIAAATSREEFDQRNERLSVLGVSNFDEFRASDVLVEINHSYKNIWIEKEQRFVRHIIVIAADFVVLLKKPISDALGLTRLPIVSWASDPDLNDLWSDGVVDSVRTINKVTNMYISQDLENRTYRNFGMYFFNTLQGQFTPRAFDPKPFGMYGVPGKPSDIIEQMRIEPLNDTAEQISFLKDLVQSSVAQTPTERGVTAPQGKATLGEIQLQFQQSQGRNEVVSKNYRKAWKESGEIFYELLNSNSSGALTLYKKANNGTYQPKEILPSSWQNPLGYECKVVLKEEQDKNNDFDMKKLGYIRNVFQNNPAAMQIVNKKTLELMDWTQDEIDQVMQPEAQPQMPQQGPMPQAPTNSQLPQ